MFGANLVTSTVTGSMLRQCSSKTEHSFTAPQYAVCYWPHPDVCKQDVEYRQPCFDKQVAGRHSRVKSCDPAFFRIIPDLTAMRILLSCILSLWSAVILADEDTARLDFFEKRIRPVLVEHCYSCHSGDAESLKAELRVDHGVALREGGESGPAVVPGKPGDSLLLSAMKYESFEMPPSGRLPDDVIADFEKWIRDGAADPRTADGTPAAAGEEIDIEQGRKFWAFQPPTKSAFLHTLGNDEPADSARIDVLVERRLQDVGIDPNGPADRRSLLRRLFIDVTGLPPTPEQVDAFVADSSSDTIAGTVDALLDSKAFGQRWARMWLDVSRFAEDQAHIVGNNKALFYPNAWKYRDWVIHALNKNVPYDRFLRLQLAADILEPENEADQPALGFIGLGPKYYRRSDPEVMAEEWEDRVDVVSRGLQGLTVACARCHDHKYDPVRTEDYYALAGVFASTEMFNKPLGTKQQNKSSEDKNSKDKEPQETLHVIREGKPQDLAVMIRGKVDHRGDVVPRGFLQVAFDGARREFKNGSGRAELAEALIDPANPLTARVIVNRIWKEYFGTGLVRTASNFGKLGERPTHPELLDDLACRFIQNGWSLKWLHRQILLSKTYQRSSKLSDAAMVLDPQNKLLWRMARRRLSVEAWRDGVLFVSGRLDSETGGPSIRPDDPEERRRTVYSAVSRFELNPLLARFDFPDPNVHAATRVETVTPLQKLFLLNNPFVMAQAEYLAERISTQTEDTKERVQLLFRLTLQRSPDSQELDSMHAFVSADETGLAQAAQTLIASNEFWYTD